MRRLPLLLSFILLLFKPLTASAEVVINFGSGINATNLRSDGRAIDRAFSFELGSFRAEFQPSPQNLDQWEDAWVPLANGKASYSDAPLRVGVVSLSENAFFGAVRLVGNEAPFLPDQKVYIWGYNLKEPGDDTEWILLTDSSWRWPAVVPDSAPNVVSFALSEEFTEAIIGQSFGPGYQLRTASIPAIELTDVAEIEPQAVEIVWTGALNLPYLTPLSEAHLSAQTVGTIPGSFYYYPEEGTVLGPGSHEIEVTFIPNDPLAYQSATLIQAVTVDDTPPVGDDGPVRNFTRSVIGIWALQPEVETPPPSGVTQPGNGESVFSQGDLKLSFGQPIVIGSEENERTTKPVVQVETTPASQVPVETGEAEIEHIADLPAVPVEKKEPRVVWKAPPSIVYGTPLSLLQLNALARDGVAGTYRYHPESGTVLDAGWHALYVEFAPDDAAIYRSAIHTVSLLVEPAPLTVIADDAHYSQAQPMPQLTASYEGLVNGDTPENLDALPEVTSDADGDSKPGIYPIQVVGGDDRNYEVTRLSGALTVTNLKESISPEQGQTLSEVPPSSIGSEPKPEISTEEPEALRPALRLTREENLIVLSWNAIPGFRLMYSPDLRSWQQVWGADKAEDSGQGSMEFTLESFSTLYSQYYFQMRKIDQ